MALAIIAEGEGTSINNVAYRVRIYSEEAVDPEVITLKLAPPIFNLTYEPETDDVAARIIPSNIELFFYNDSDEIDTLLDDILQNQEAGYYITIEQDRGAGYSKYWSGVILQDQIETIEASKPFMAVIRAVDGLNRLQNVDYDFENKLQILTNRGVVSGRTPLHIIIYNCLAQALPLDLWPETIEAFLSNTVNWWTDITPFDALKDPLFGYLFDVRDFQNTEEVTINAEDNDTVEVINYLSCFEVLDELARLFISRVYMSRGYWFFEQVSEKSGSLTKRNVYNKFAMSMSNSTVPSNEPLNGTRGAVRMRDNTDAYFSALKKVSVNQTYLADIKQRGFINRPHRSGSYSSVNPEVILYNFAFFRGARINGIISVSHDFGLFDNVIRLGASGPNVPQVFTFEIRNEYIVQEELSVANVPTTVVGGATYYHFGLRAIVDLEITSDSVESNTTYYLQDDLTWSTSVNTITVEAQRSVGARLPQFDITLTLGNGVKIKTLIFQAPPEVGVLSVTASNWNIQRLSSVNPEGWTTIAIGSLDLFNGGGLFFNIKTRSNGDNFVRFFSITNNDTNIADNQTLDYGDLIFQDGAVQTGAIWANATNTFGSDERISDWRYGNESTGTPLGALVARERLALQRKPLNIYDGAVQMPLGYDVTISFDGKRLVPLNLTFNAFEDLSSGRYFLINRFESLGEQVQQSLNLPTLGNPFDEFNGSDSIFGKTFSENQIGPFLLVEDQASAQIPFRTINGRRENIRSITAEASGSDTATAFDEVIYYVWSGSNGSFTQNLPEISTDMEGMRITIKLDAAFTGNQNIVLTPTGGDTINGETSLEVDGSGSFPKNFTLYVVDGNWVV